MCFIELWNVNAGDLCKRKQQVFSFEDCSFESLYYIDNIVNDIFAFANCERVDERVHGFRVGGGMSTGDDDRVRLVSLHGAKRKAREIENVLGVSVEGFVVHGKTK